MVSTCMLVEVRGRAAPVLTSVVVSVVVSTSSPSAVAMSMAHSSKSLKLRMAPAMLACTCNQRPLRVIRRPSGGHQEAISLYLRRVVVLLSSLDEGFNPARVPHIESKLFA